MEIEVCVYSLESCLAAQEAGADRVELCASVYDGGTTPSAGTIRLARNMLHIGLYVMIRPRGGDFLYTDIEYGQMKEDLLYAKACGVDGVVFGLLKGDGQVDVLRTKELVELAAPLPVTFHRAFDMTCDYKRALEDVIAAGCHRILTSGQRNTALEGKTIIKDLVEQAAGRIQIMAGSGINVANALEIATTGVDALHMSGKKTRDSRMEYRNSSVFMGGVPGIPEYGIVYSDRDKIDEVIRKLRSKE